MPCPKCPVFSTLPPVLSLPLSFLNRMVTNPERRKKCLIYHAEVLSCFVLFFCDYVKLSRTINLDKIFVSLVC